MVVKVYISGISGNKEVKKRQQRVLMILDSKNVQYEVIDITEPGKEDDKEFMQTNSKTRDSKYPLPPQIFNEDNYCGDYESFDLANEIDELDIFLKTNELDSQDDKSIDDSSSKNKQNGNSSSREMSTDKDLSENEKEIKDTTEVDDDIVDDNGIVDEDDDADDADVDADDDDDVDKTVKKVEEINQNNSEKDEQQEQEE